MARVSPIVREARRAGRDELLPELWDTLECLAAASDVGQIELPRIREAADRMEPVSAYAALALRRVVGDLADPARGLGFARVRLQAFVDGAEAALGALR